MKRLSTEALTAIMTDLWNRLPPDGTDFAHFTDDQARALAELLAIMQRPARGQRAELIAQTRGKSDT